MEHSLDIDIDHTSQNTTVRLLGEFDIRHKDEVAEAIAAEIARSASVTVDLSQLRFIDTVGMACLVAGRRKAAAAHCSFQVRGAAGQVHLVMEIAGLEWLYEDPTPALRRP